jgi:hypothetical protein
MLASTPVLQATGGVSARSAGNAEVAAVPTKSERFKLYRATHDPAVKTHVMVMRRGCPITDVQQLAGKVSMEVVEPNEEDFMLEDVKAVEGAGSAFGDGQKLAAQLKRQEARAEARALADRRVSLKAEKVNMIGSQTRKGTSAGPRWYVACACRFHTQI